MDRDKRDTEEWEWTRAERDFSQGGQGGRNKFTALACQFHALALPACQPLFLLAPYLEFPFKGIIMFTASPVQDPRTKQKRLCHSHCLYPVVFWTDGHYDGRALWCFLCSSQPDLAVSQTRLLYTRAGWDLGYSLSLFVFFPSHASLPMHLPFSLCPLATILCS